LSASQQAELPFALECLSRSIQVYGRVQDASNAKHGKMALENSIRSFSEATLILTNLISVMKPNACSLVLLGYLCLEIFIMNNKTTREPWHTVNLKSGIDSPPLVFHPSPPSWAKRDLPEFAIAEPIRSVFLHQPASRRSGIVHSKNKTPVIAVSDSATPSNLNVSNFLTGKDMLNSIFRMLSSRAIQNIPTC